VSKHAQQNQSAFSIGRKIGKAIAKQFGDVDNQFFTHLVKQYYTGAKRFHSVIRQAARIGYYNQLEKAAKAAQIKAYTDALTGDPDAKL